MQFPLTTLPNVTHNLALPQLCKDVLHTGTIPSMHIVVLLLHVSQLPFSPKRNHNMNVSLVCPIMHAHIKLETIPQPTMRPLLVPNQNIRGGCAPGIFFDPCPTGDLLGGALSALRAQCNYLDV